jgi:tetratricopeptide (TPR) repeat protein
MFMEGGLTRRLFVVIFLFLAVSFGGDLRVSSDDTANADAALETKQYQLAKELYRQVYINASQAGESAKAIIGIAKADFGLKNYYEAGINLKRFLQTYPNSPLANEAHLVWGLSLLQIKKYKEAEEQLGLVGGELEQKAYMAKAELELLKGNTEGSEKFLSKLDKKAYESNNRVLYMRAMVLSRQGKHTEAIVTINRIPDQGLKEENIAVSKAIIYYNARKYIDAKDMLTNIIKNPSSRIEDVQAKRTLFQINEMENNDDETLALALELLDYEATDEMKMKVVSIYDKRAETDHSFRYLVSMRDKKIMSAEIEKRLKKMVLEKEPKVDEYIAKFYVYVDVDSPYNMELSKIMTGKGNKDVGRRILQRAIKGKSGSEAAVMLGEMLVAEKKYGEAKRIVLPVTTDAHFSGQACLIMAQVLENEGDESGASSYRMRAIRVLDVQKDYFRVGELYMRVGNRAEALKNYVRAADKGNVVAMVKSADLFYLTGKLDRARVYYRKAIDKGIQDPKSQQWVSYQYGKLARDDEYLDKAKAGGGIVAEAAELMKRPR